MKLQLLIVLLFALNLLIFWTVILTKRLAWYKYFAGFFFVVLPLLGVIFNQPRFELDFFWWRLAGLAAISLGLAALAWAKSVKGRFGGFSTGGPYQFLRHPVYLGLIFIFVGWWWVWAAIYSFYFGMFILALIWLQGYLEERFILQPKFGDKFASYRRRTGMFWIK